MFENTIVASLKLPENFNLVTSIENLKLIGKQTYTELIDVLWSEETLDSLESSSLTK